MAKPSWPCASGGCADETVPGDVAEVSPHNRIPRPPLAEELKRCDWPPDELPHRPKGDLHKITIARPLRAQTTLAWAWIAHHLSLGAPDSVANRLRNSQQ